MRNGIHAYVLKQFKVTEQSYQQIADGTGLSKRTIEKIARGEIEDPGVSHVQKLHDYFRSQERASA